MGLSLHAAGSMQLLWQLIEREQQDATQLPALHEHAPSPAGGGQGQQKPEPPEPPEPKRAQGALEPEKQHSKGAAGQEKREARGAQPGTDDGRAFALTRCALPCVWSALLCGVCMQAALNRVPLKPAFTYCVSG